jgi:uncharacterized protein YbaP (TraB family)
LGSIHSGTPDLYPLPKQIEAAFRSSSVLVVEVNLNKIDDRRLRSVMAEGFYPPGDSLWKHVTAEGKQEILNFCARHGVAPDFIAALKPWMVIMAIGGLPLSSNGMSPQLGIDRHFLNQVFRGMPVEEIETLEQQAQLFPAMVGRDPERTILQTLRGVESGARFTPYLQDAWLAGDTRKLEELVSAMGEGDAEWADKVIDRRNVHMAAVVERHLNETATCFVVVGAAHLVGEHGVVRLLEEKGYRVEQVFSPAQ